MSGGVISCDYRNGRCNRGPSIVAVYYNHHYKRIVNTLKNTDFRHLTTNSTTTEPRPAPRWPYFLACLMS